MVIAAASTALPASSSLLERFLAVRGRSLDLAAPLSAEDAAIQTMDDVSPTKWHLAHTTWFFETFVLAEVYEDYESYHPSYGYLFNSYYNSVGSMHPRPQRGLLSRPGLEEILEYRSVIDGRIAELVDEGRDFPAEVLRLGIEHEQQHQELLLTDIKHVLAANPLEPAYRSDLPEGGGEPPGDLQWLRFDEGLREVGYSGARDEDSGFAFDNEGPRHSRYQQAFKLASRPVTNREYRAFIEDGGYRRPELWLSDGWIRCGEEQWQAPLYWRREGDDWSVFSLGGLRALADDEPVCHVSYYEADAYATWAERRLPGEDEWEVAVEGLPVLGNWADDDALHPQPAKSSASATLQQAYGDVWEWTRSPYSPYPGYRPPDGALGEYNGKFMANQMVLRGGSCATAAGHLRPTYRNFFPPDARWQFSGIRLADDA